MIYQGSRDQEKAISALLHSVLDAKSAKAWLKTRYSPETMLYAAADPDENPNSKKIDGFLQVIPRTISFQNRKALINIIDLGAGSPSADPSTMPALLEAAIMVSRKSSLLAGITTANPQAFAPYGFVPISTRKKAWIHQNPDCHFLPNGLSFSLWKEEDLYPAYRRFMQLFDGSVILDDRQFAAAMSRMIIEGKKIIVFKHNRQVSGFAVLNDQAADPVIELAIYPDLESLQALMQQVWDGYGAFWLYLSSSEPLSAIWPDLWKQQDFFCVSLSDPAAFSRFLHQKKGEIPQDADAEFFFDRLEQPAWNFIL